MALPADPIILLSYLNTQLRDFYPDLTQLCADLNAERGAVENAMESVGYRYDPVKNQFVRNAFPAALHL